MVRIKVDAATAHQIEQSREPIELYDDGGRQVGYFSCLISAEDLVEARRRAATSRDGLSLDDVWARIKSRHNQR